MTRKQRELKVGQVVRVITQGEGTQTGEIKEIKGTIYVVQVPERINQYTKQVIESKIYRVLRSEII